jgi:hypothetical protein
VGECTAGGGAQCTNWNDVDDLTNMVVQWVIRGLCIHSLILFHVVILAFCFTVTDLPLMKQCKCGNTSVLNHILITCLPIGSTIALNRQYP